MKLALVISVQFVKLHDGNLVRGRDPVKKNVSIWQATEAVIDLIIYWIYSLVPSHRPVSKSIDKYSSIIGQKDS